MKVWNERFETINSFKVKDRLSLIIDFSHTEPTQTVRYNNKNITVLT